MTIKASTYLATKFGEFKLCYHELGEENSVSLSMGKLDIGSVLVRIHSSCLLGESFFSQECDCSLQLEKSMEVISKEKQGVIVYLFQEGRGHGLESRIKSLELERTKNMDTVEAYRQLNSKVDKREYGVAVKVLEDLGVGKDIRLITNNPRKQEYLKESGYRVVKKVDLEYSVGEKVKTRLKMKKEKLGHDVSSALIGE